MKNKLFLCSLALAGVQAMNNKLSAQYNCQAGFTFTVNTHTVVFTNTSTGITNNTSYHWNFGDGNYSSIASPAHVYANNGVYTACLYVVDSTTQCWNQFCDTIVIGNANPPCNLQAGFTFYSSTNGVYFSNTSTGASAPHYYWDLGDGNYSTATNPTHTYQYNGTYMVCLYVYDTLNYGCYSHWCDSIVITGSANPPCHVTITGNTAVNAGSNTTLSASFSPSCANVSYVWSTGWQSASIAVSPTVTTTYTVIAYCASANCYGTGAITVTVNPSCNLQAGFTFNSANDPQIDFTNTSTGASALFSFWDFGDGSPTAAVSVTNPTHIYQYNGTYMVCLYVYDTLNYGCYSHWCDTIVITNAQPYTCNMTVSTTAIYYPVFGSGAHAFVAGGIPPYTYSWSNGQTAQTVTGLATGTYSVCATDASGCSACSAVTITAQYSCSATIILYPDNTNPLLWYLYTYIMGVPPFNYLWDFGDGNTSTQPNPSHTYNTAGHYNICLTVTDATGCSSSTCDSTYKLITTMGTGIIKDLVIVNPLTGIEENPVSVNSLFPNPADDRIEVSFSDFVKGELRITDITGREVYAEKINSNNVRINVSTFPVGYYTLSIVSEAKTIHNKIMIAR